MTTVNTSGLIRQLRRAALLPGGGDISDADLLEAFISRRDEAAFEVLLRRHGPMVLGVAYRILNHPHDAEDAFQATFLVLVRKAESIVPRALVGHWLYGVAFRTAMKAKAMKSKRRTKESLACPRPKSAAADLWEELKPVLDRELNALPAKYRLAVFLCDVEGKKHREAARQLGWPAGTLETRLAAGRRLLARRLARHGLTPCGAALAGLITENAGAALPPALVAGTLRTGMSFAAGAAASGAAASHITTLAEGIMKAMLLSKVKVAAGLCLALAVLCAAPSVFTYSAPEQTTPARTAAAQKPAAPATVPVDAALRLRLESREWQMRSVDAKKRTISVQDRGAHNWGMGLQYIQTASGAFGPAGLFLKDLKLERNVRITLNSKPANLGDLNTEARLLLRFSADNFRIAQIEAFTTSQPVHTYVLSEIVPARNTISVTVDGDVKLQAVPLASDVDIEIHSSAGVRKAALRDLQAGMTVHLELAPDDAGKLSVRAIKAAK